MYVHTTVIWHRKIYVLQHRMGYLLLFIGRARDWKYQRRDEWTPPPLPPPPARAARAEVVAAAVAGIAWDFRTGNSKNTSSHHHTNLATRHLNIFSILRSQKKYKTLKYEHFVIFERERNCYILLKQNIETVCLVNNIQLFVSSLK